jgi:hypothetical protein
MDTIDELGQGAAVAVGLLQQDPHGEAVVSKPSVVSPDEKRLPAGVSRRVVSYDNLKWAVLSFQIHKSPGIDGIRPITLQRGFELLAGKLLVFLRTSVDFRYIPISRRHIRVMFMPKPGKTLCQAKSLRPFSLMSFTIKTHEKLLDRHIRDGVLVEKPLHQNQYAYRTGMSTETALFKVVRGLEK